MNSLGFVKLEGLPDSGAAEVVRFDVFVAATAKVSPFNFKQDSEIASRSMVANCLDIEGCTLEENVPIAELTDSLAQLRYQMQLIMNVYGISEQQLLNICAEKHLQAYKDTVYGVESQPKKAK